MKTSRTTHAPDELFFFNRADMMALADKLRDDFAQAEPFEHVAIDNFLPEQVARQIGEAFPKIDEIDWWFDGPGDSAHSGSRKIEKVSSSDVEQFPPAIRHMMGEFQSGIFCAFLDRLTGHQHLMPDGQHYGCGMHSTGSGGRLMLHVDASRHPNKRLNQLINCIYYCTPDWQDEWDGALELWDESATRCVQRIKPRFNRLAIFRVSGKTWHGHPNPVLCPPGIRRNSLALYYYTVDTNATGYEYSNFVRWKAVTKHDRPTPLHRAKVLVRAMLPTPVVNTVADFVRRAGLNFKGGK